MITNRPNSKGDSYFVNSENKLTDDIQKECNSDTENESNVNPRRLSNIDVEERSPPSFNCLTPAGSNQMAVSKFEDRFEQLENGINSLEDLINKELVPPKTVLEKNGPYENHLDRDVEFLREEISSKNYIIKTLLESISEINSSFYKHSHNQNIKQDDNAETRDDFVFQKSKKNKLFNTVNRLSRLNENVLSPNRFEQLTLEDNAKESPNVEKYDHKSTNNPTESYVSEANLNSNYSSRPRKMSNCQTHLTTHKRPTTVVNRRPDNQDVYQRKEVVPGRQTYCETIGKRSNKIVILDDSITKKNRRS